MMSIHVNKNMVKNIKNQYCIPWGKKTHENNKINHWISW